MFDYLVFIGRFAPYHIGHHHVALEALNQSKNLIFVIGSANEPRSIRNPYFAMERESIIRSAFDEGMQHRIGFLYAEDHPYNEEKWLTQIQSMVNGYAMSSSRPWSGDAFKVGLVGYAKDHSSYYLKMFPRWESVDVPACHDINATDYRNIFFDSLQGVDDPRLEAYYVNPIHRGVARMMGTRAVNEGLIDEYNFIRNYRKQWANSPYPPVFQTVDAIVSQSGHLLLVTRKAIPGMGLMALPGGFVNPHETLLQAVLRELREETTIKVPEPVLKGSIVEVRTFDYPYRSARGRTFTTCYDIRLSPNHRLPQIKGGDDAAKAMWVPFAAFEKMRHRMFEDHYSIAMTMLGL